jgi:hypothetical protein
MDLRIARPLTARRSARVGAMLLTRCRRSDRRGSDRYHSGGGCQQKCVVVQPDSHGDVSTPVGMSTQTLQQVNDAIGRHKQWPLHDLGRRYRDGSHHRHIRGKDCPSVATISRWRSHKANDRVTVVRCRQR